MRRMISAFIATALLAQASAQTGGSTARNSKGPKFNRTQQWNFTSPKTSIDASPVLSTDGRTMFVSDYGTSLYAVATAESNRSAGVAYWKFTTGAGTGAGNSPTVSPDGNTVYVGALDGYLYAVATADGTQRWKFATNDGLLNVGISLIVSADSKTVYVNALSIGFIAINAATGVPRWKLPISIGQECGAVLSPDDGTVYVSKSDEAAHNGNFYAINTANGKTRWTVATRGYYYYVPAVSPDGNTVYVGSVHISTNTGSFYALNAADGTPRWNYTAGGTAWSQPIVSPTGDMVYVGKDGDSFHAINAADGTLRWEIPIRITDFSKPVLSHDGSTVYVVLDERLCAVDTVYGTLQWEFHKEFVDQGDDYVFVDSSVALGPDGRTVYVGTKSFPTNNMVVFAVLTAPPMPAN